jgi:hypothetical protein
VTTVLALLPWLGHASGFRTEAGAGGWQFTIAPSVWVPRTRIDLTVDDLGRSASLEFPDVVEDLRFGFTTHFDASWREWTLLLDVLYFKLEKDDTTGAGVPTEVDLQEVLVELGATHRLATIPVGRSGGITLEPLAGARLMYVDTEISIGRRLRLHSSTLIDPMVGGRVAYHVTDAMALWVRADAAGFGISDSQSQLTYNLIAGLSWRFARAASVHAGWRYMRFDIEKGRGATRLAVDLSMNGPFVGLSAHF